MEKFRFTSIQRILAKFNRDYRNLEIDEIDIIEWIGEALDFMKMPSASEHALFFAEVKDNYVDLPARLHYITQIGRDTRWVKDSCHDTGITPAEVITQQPLETIPNVTDCEGNTIIRYELASYQPIFNLNYVFNDWANCNLRQRFQPVRLANHSLFGTLVCEGFEPEDYSANTGRDEYTIEGDRMKFSFREGFIVMPYIRQKVEPGTGYPMIPDDAYAIAAITYYIIWKINERECWSHREGACQLAQMANAKWDNYILKFKNKAKMPSGIDDYQDLMEQSMYMIPNSKRYYGFFGKLNTPENRNFKDPDNTQRNSNYNYGRQR